MNIEAYDLITSITTYLESEVTAMVPSEKRSDLRAATKLLADISAELDGLFPRLASECSELYALCQLSKEKLSTLVDKHGTDNNGYMELAEYVSSYHYSSDINSLSAWVSAKEKANLFIGEVCVKLSELKNLSDYDDSKEILGQLLSDFYTTLGQWADKRVEWQSVFPKNQRFSDLYSLFDCKL